ncbi:MAG TPA: sensor domain-containing protein, partial [Streptosporangiaceae bacterium]|nr:sensor domain-containing protein [Streptosporangiaceae bacterium]
MSTPATSPPAGSRLPMSRNPVRLLLSASPWRAACYLLSYLIVSGLLFAVVLTASVTTAALAVTVALAPLLIASAAMIRGCATVERVMLRQVLRQPVHGSYPPPAGPGLWRRAGGAWSSAIWRDLAYLAGLWVPLYVLDAVAFAVWLSLLAGVTLPLWYRHVVNVCFGNCGGQHVPGLQFGSFPAGPHGPGASGLWVYPSVGPALLITAGCLVALLLFNYVLVLTARLHAATSIATYRRKLPWGPARRAGARPPAGGRADR